MPYIPDRAILQSCSTYAYTPPDPLDHDPPAAAPGRVRWYLRCTPAAVGPGARRAAGDLRGLGGLDGYRPRGFRECHAYGQQGPGFRAEVESRWQGPATAVPHAGVVVTEMAMGPGRG